MTGLRTGLFARKSLGLSVLLVALAGPTVTAWSTEIDGFVVLERLNGAPVPGVQVSTRGAAPVRSANDGTFRLILAKPQGGREVNLQVRDNQRIVVNREALDVRLFAGQASRRDQVVIILAAPEDEWARRTEYLQFLVRRAIDRNQWRISAAWQRNEPSAAEEDPASAHAEQDRAAAIAMTAGDCWAQQAGRLQLANAPQYYRGARRLFALGRLEGALAMLSSTPARSNSDEWHVATRQFGALLLVMGLDFDAAAHALAQGVREAPGSFDAWFGYGCFHHASSELVMARQGLGRALSLARNDANLRQAASALLRLGALSRNEGRNDQAKGELEEALGLYQHLASREPASDAQALARTLIELGSLGRDEQNIPYARQRYQEALAVYEGLAKKNPSFHLANVALTREALGSISRTERRFDEALQQYEEVLKIRRRAAAIDTKALRYVAETLNTLGSVSRQANRNKEARRYFEEALQLHGGQLRDNESVLPDLATALSNLGTLSTLDHKGVEAKVHYEESLRIRRRLAQANPRLHLAEVAQTLDNLGSLNTELKSFIEARQQFGEALSLRRVLVADSRATYLLDLASTLNNFATLNRAEDRNDDARTQYEEALRHYLELSRVDGESHLHYVATALSNLGSLSRAEKRFDEARRLFEEALQIRRVLVASNPGLYLPDLAATLNNLGNLNGTVGLNADARAQYEEALQIRRSVAESDPDAYLPLVALTLNNLGALNRIEGRVHEARTMFQEALRIYRYFESRSSGRFSRELAVVEWNLDSVTP